MIGVVADDITGSNDIGIMFAKAGLVVDVYSLEDVDAVIENNRRPDILILDTDSRFDEPKTAYDKVYKATKILQSLGVDRFYNKTCSVFRGNIGPEFDAMLDALEEEVSVVVLGFPKNGRVTKNGIHYVHGKKLEESEFRQDPMHPMTQSNLVDILQSQTDRKVGAVDFENIQNGSLREQVDVLKEDYSYIILDVTDQNDLTTIAKSLKDTKVFGGSSALAEEIAILEAGHANKNAKPELPTNQLNLGLLIAAGSLMPQTAKQIQYMKEKGCLTLEIDTRTIFDEQKREQQKTEYISTICEVIQGGSDVLIHSANNPNIVEETKLIGAKAGLTQKEISQTVSGMIAEITKQVLENTGQNRFIIAGGDTSAAVCSQLGIKGMTVWKEIQPGLPSCISITDEKRLFVLKSGSFGTPDFFEKAILHLKEEKGDNAC